MKRNNIECIVNIPNQYEFQHLKKKKKYYDQISTVPFWDFSDIVINCNSENMDNKQRSSSDSSELGSLGDSQMELCADVNTVMNNNGNEETYSCPICRTVNSDRTSHLEHVATHRSKAKSKTKTFSCKQCQFIATTKYEYWEHSRKHIKPEKLLTCTQCPFVTEFKHHLDYHMTNHMGAKPFKCDQCSYSCVNNSMLRSHLKSHLKIYQYRCADCNFASKYHHTLKIHLRKQNHQPAVILNEDGTPDPIKIIDVYGRCRGSKKNSKTAKQRKKVVQKTSVEQNNAIPSMVAHTQDSSISSLVASVDSANSIGPSTNGLVNDVINEVNIPDELPVMVNKTTTSPSCSNQLLSDGESRKQLSPMDFNTRGSFLSDENSIISDQQSVTSKKGNGSNRRKGKAYKLNREFEISNSASENEEINKSNCYSGVSIINENNYHPNCNDRSNDPSNNLSHEKDQCDNNSQDQPIDYSMNGPRIHNNPSTSIDSIFSMDSAKFLLCKYCEIMFLHEIMFKVHMSYHGTENPYVCVKCGHNAIDKVSFFLHISTSSH
ncbi:hypothetical protein M0804_010418 [Polistes exclamans]|nr:hypothetical protein M0804_010418 [Polistes exclamans]